MTEVKSTNNILRKEVIPGVTVFSLGLLVVAGVIGVILTIIDLVDIVNVINNGELTNDGAFGMDPNIVNLISTLIMLVDIPLGLFVASLLSNRSKWAPIGMGGETIFYAFAILLTQNWALFIANGIYTPLIWLYGFFAWRNDADLLQDTDKAVVSGEVKTKKLNLKSLLIVIGTTIGITILFGFLLPILLPKFFVGSKSFMIATSGTLTGYSVNPASGIPEWFGWFQIWFDAFLATIAIVATTMAVFRYAETWLLFFISNTFKLLLFGVTLIVAADTASPMMFVMAAAYFANALYGMIVWKDGEEVDILKKKEAKA